jgi:hypothetical protein
MDMYSMLTVFHILDKIKIGYFLFGLGLFARIDMAAYPISGTGCRAVQLARLLPIVKALKPAWDSWGRFLVWRS